MIDNIVFPRDLLLRRKREAADGHLFFVEREYRVEYDKDDQRWRYTVPAGYATDLASVPLGFRNVASKVDGVEASIVHDHAYEYQTLPRAEADDLFLALLKAIGIGWAKRNIMWSAVRAGGWVLYRRHEPVFGRGGPVVLKHY